MENTNIKVLLCDDEQIVREGLRYIIDWEALGFTICGEAENGEDALAKIEKYKPGLVLMDIRMPKISGLELIAMMRGSGFTGEFIILSGYSDFEYARTAIRHGVSFYLTKPIDEDELEQALVSIREKISSRKDKERKQKQYLSKAKAPVLYDLLNGTVDSGIDYRELGLDLPVYQTAAVSRPSEEAAPFDFDSYIGIGNRWNSAVDDISFGSTAVYLLKGSYAVKRLAAALEMEDRENGIPAGTVLACGPAVYSLEEIESSYEACRKLLANSFFFDENQKIVTCEDLPAIFERVEPLDPSLAKDYSRRIADYIQVCARRRISDQLTELKTITAKSGAAPEEIKYFFSDLFLQIEQHLRDAFKNQELALPGNAEVIMKVTGARFLYQIQLYFTQNFEKIIEALGNQTGESLFDDIVYYIERNYAQPLKLENIAPLFGYNSSYLGKLFKQRTGQNFNNYLDEIRISESRKLLEETQLRVYEIASRVGYRNVDYFHQKFKKQMGQSPAEYRKLHE